MVLNEAALVLNSNWNPIGFATVRRALELMVTDRAEAVLPDYTTHDFESWADLAVMKGEPCIRTVKLEIKVPEVIRLNKYGGFPKRRVKLSRRNLYKRDNVMCQYCGRHLKSEDATIDHIIPRTLGGRTTWLNCVIACIKCNTKKGARALEHAGMKLIRKPFEPPWVPTIRFATFKRKTSWDNFISEAYWNVELEE